LLTILTYSVFSGLTYFATELWQIGLLRFLVALGVGGEWSVAAALVAEVFQGRARTFAGAIFHASSILGTWLAGLAALAVGTQWRYAYLLGVLPALLVIAIRAGVAEPNAAERAKPSSCGAIGEMFADARWRARALLGFLLAAVGLGTFWGVTIAGQDLTETLLLRNNVEPSQAAQKAKFAFAIVQTAGGGLGLLAFGPLADRFGRRRAFIGMQLAALVVVPVVCFVPTQYWHMLVLLPVYGFCTLGIHAGFAIYFPELFPTRLRATASGFCFNGGRLLAASVLFFSGWLKARPGMDLRVAVTLLSSLFLLGIVVALLLPETKDQPLPE
jgi:MFS family permease